MPTNAIKEMLKKHEGFSAQIYKCQSNKNTIGYGRNLDSNGISRDEAEYLLNNDINKCINQLENELGFFFDLPIEAMDVLINMCYNMGINNLMGFRRTLAYMRAEEWGKASKEMLDSRWANQVPSRAKELSEIIKNLEK